MSQPQPLSAADIDQAGGDVVAREKLQTIMAWKTITADQAAVTGDRLSVDTSAASRTITLPAGGGMVTLRDHAGTWDSHPVTVLGNGRTIDGATSIALDLVGFEIALASVGGAWRYTLNFMYGG
jgi:hypothetical protein